MKTLAVLFFSLVVSSAFSQIPSDANLDFERGGGAWPMMWQKWGRGYSLSVDSVIQYAGKYSVRISADSGRAEGSFGCAATALKASFAGSRIELRGYLKLDGVSNGKAGLFMRTDGLAGMAGIVDVTETGTEGTVDWKQYSVSLPLEGVGRIWVGALNSGSGALWADNLEVFVDGRPAAEMTKTAPADTDHVFDKGSPFRSIAVSSKALNDLVLLGKVWGFLKYYHPVIAAGNLHWDYELFRFLPRLMKARSKSNRNAVLSSWIDSIGLPPENPLPPAIDSARAKIVPDLDWIGNTSELGKELSAKLKRIRDASRALVHYYVGFSPGAGNPDFSAERAYEVPSYPDAGFRLLSLYRYWNIIEYFFPYRHLVDDWDGMLKAYLPKFLGAANDLEYRLAALELIGRVNDTHANIWRDKILDEYRGKLSPPCEVRFVEDRPIVFRTAENDSIHSDLQVGDVIVSVSGRSVREIVKKWRPLAPASNEARRMYEIGQLMLRTNDTTLRVDIERGGKHMNVTVRCYEGSQAALQAKTRMRKMWKRLPGEVGYIFPGVIKNDSLESIVASLKNTKGLIIDLRSYPSDFMVFTMGAYLMPHATPFVKFTKGSVVQPGVFLFGSALAVGKENTDYYKGKVLLLINETTLSQAEYTTMAFRVAPRATVIGSTTAAADGNVSPIVLSGGISTLISGIGIYYPDGRETQRVGILPDMVVRPTIKGIREGRDEVLERAVEVAGKE